MKILHVFAPNNPSKLITYSKVISNEIIKEVEEAFESLDIHVEPETVEDIAYRLELETTAWYKERYGFEIHEPLEY